MKKGSPPIPFLAVLHLLFHVLQAINKTLKPVFPPPIHADFPKLVVSLAFIKPTADLWSTLEGLLRSAFEQTSPLFTRLTSK